MVDSGWWMVARMCLPITKQQGFRASCCLVKVVVVSPFKISPNNTMPPAGYHQTGRVSRPVGFANSASCQLSTVNYLTLVRIADRFHTKHRSAHEIYNNIQFVCLVTNVGIFSR